jgi:hypothetical protein
LRRIVGLSTKNEASLLKDQVTNQNRSLLAGVLHQRIDQLGFSVVEIDANRICSNKGGIGVHASILGEIKILPASYNREGNQRPKGEEKALEGGRSYSGIFGGFMRACLVVLLTFSLQGCFFFYIPGSVFAAGNACASRNVVVGQRLYDAQTGKYGTIKEVHGRSDRCQTDERPILVTREFD